MLLETSVTASSNDFLLGVFDRSISIVLTQSYNIKI